MIRSVLAALGVACLSAITLGQDAEEPLVPQAAEKDLVDKSSKEPGGQTPKSPRPSSSETASDRLVLKDGAVFLKLTGSEILIPLPGGGASGCFGELDRESRDKPKPTPKPPSQ